MKRALVLAAARGERKGLRDTGPQDRPPRGGRPTTRDNGGLN
jgi:hypothetical protein